MGIILGLFIFLLIVGIVLVEFEDGFENEMFIFKNLIIVIGFKLCILNGLSIDEENVLLFDGVLNLEILLKLIIIVGGGVIGMEWVLMMYDFGVEVIVLEYVDWILLIEDKEVVKELVRFYKKKKLIMYIFVEV